MSSPLARGGEMDTRFWLAITGQPKAKQPCRVGQEWDIIITISIIKLLLVIYCFWGVRNRSSSSLGQLCRVSTCVMSALFSVMAT